MHAHSSTVKCSTYAAEIKAAFLKTATDLETVIVLDGIDSDSPGFRIRSHDRLGPLPAILIPEDGDGGATLGSVRHSACKLAALVNIREEIARKCPEVRFPPEVPRHEMDSLIDGYRKVRRLVREY